MSYKRMKNDKSMCHDFDFSRRYRCQQLLRTFAYLNNGRYSIIAERFMHPLAGERAQEFSVFFNSRMANVSATYHTLLSTCRMSQPSTLKYVKKFFHEIVKERKDYENLLPMTIGMSTNKH